MLLEKKIRDGYLTIFNLPKNDKRDHTLYFFQALITY